ncbi:uncharacterized protein BO88DRAFT_7188 [Aspergillus vadensis CBS 113365]|uniref:Uncharacterized protein n=1 Tax=Aspergillus vadensis (strain CBS 113365 / IMI 142717 / IBT 24658) TaxID=1448311 RepID=A0A319CG23_ASPVC|nr:hypothetical protein BO88DRAFT_7188 [Aspergillus vadensis CBS 113365]PYH74298.1 hypothetical protein BO88DRAFT_7188 [Aspergillus vadensis CBS 113365]
MTMGVAVGMTDGRLSGARGRGLSVVDKDRPLKLWLMVGQLRISFYFPLFSLIFTYFKFISFTGGNDQIGLCGGGFFLSILCQLRSFQAPGYFVNGDGLLGLVYFHLSIQYVHKTSECGTQFQREMRRYEIRQDKGGRSKSKIASRFMSFLVIRVHVARYVWLEAKGSSIR